MMKGIKRMNSVVSMGVEEEFFLIDSEGAVARSRPDELLPTLIDRLGDQVSPEVLQGTIEVKTRPAANAASLFNEMRELRSELRHVCGNFGFRVLGIGAHPFSCGIDQMLHTEPRYERIGRKIGYPMKRYLTNALHIHLGIPNPESRLKIFNRLRYFLPLISALSASSPFWAGVHTGCSSYRLAAYDELPRTGIPYRLASLNEYTDYTNKITELGLLDDLGQIWWDIRISHKFPTIEIRIADANPNVVNSHSIACLSGAIAEYLACDNDNTIEIDSFEKPYLDENRYQARNHGTNASLILPRISKSRTASPAEILASHNDEFLAVGGSWFSYAESEICKNLSERNIADSMIHEVSGNVNDKLEMATFSKSLMTFALMG